MKPNLQAFLCGFLSGMRMDENKQMSCKENKCKIKAINVRVIRKADQNSSPLRLKKSTFELFRPIFPIPVIFFHFSGITDKGILRFTSVYLINCNLNSKTFSIDGKSNSKTAVTIFLKLFDIHRYLLCAKQKALRYLLCLNYKKK